MDKEHRLERLLCRRDLLESELAAIKRTIRPIRDEIRVEKKAARVAASRQGIQERAQERRQTAANRRDYALLLRRSGLKWREVGEKLGGISPTSAIRLVAMAIRREKWDAEHRKPRKSE